MTLDFYFLLWNILKGIMYDYIYIYTNDEKILP